MSRFGARNSNFGSAPSSSGDLRLSAALNRARQTGTLNLSSLNLSTLPPDVMNLRDAVLKGDTSDGMKAWEVYGEEALVSVDLSDNNFSTLDPNHLCVFESVKKLRLRRCCLTQLSLPHLAPLSQLHTLDVSDNGLSGPLPLSLLPEALVELDLSNNSFSTISSPPSQYHPPLPRLKKLVLTGNRISSLDPSLSFASITPSLLHLDLSSNRLPLFPPPLPPSIAFLSLADNNLSTFPPLPHLPSLLHLNLSSNNLQTAPPVPPCLQTLDLSCNRITSVNSLSPSVAGGGEGMRMLELRLRGNRLHSIQCSTLALMLDLTLLDLSDNDLSDVPPVRRAPTRERSSEAAKREQRARAAPARAKQRSERKEELELPPRERSSEARTKKS
jgi:Leucine-rich repeat (LRR) protein